MKRAKRQMRLIQEAADLIQRVSERVQQRVHGTVAKTVTKCVQAVYGERYGFDLEFKRARGKTVCTPYILKDNMRLEAKDTSGGGLLDVISFALRATFLVLSQPNKRRLLVLDEPFRGVDSRRIKNVRGMILEMSESLGIQFLIVTHNRALDAGKIITMGGKDDNQEN